MLESLELIIFIVLFTIIVVISKNAIEEGLKMPEPMAWAFSICVAILAMTGIVNPESNKASDNEIVERSILPYVVYGISCILAAFLGWLFRCPKRRNHILGWFIKDDVKKDDRANKK